MFFKDITADIASIIQHVPDQKAGRKYLPAMFDRPVGSMASLNSGTRPAAPPSVILTHRLICIYLLNLPPDRSPRPPIPDGSRCKKHLAIICFMARYINKTTFRGIWAQYKIDHRMFHRRPPYGFKTGYSAMRLALPR